MDRTSVIEALNRFNGALTLEDRDSALEDLESLFSDMFEIFWQDMNQMGYFSEKQIEVVTQAMFTYAMMRAFSAGADMVNPFEFMDSMLRGER